MKMKVTKKKCEEKDNERRTKQKQKMRNKVHDVADNNCYSRLCKCASV